MLARAGIPVVAEVAAGDADAAAEAAERIGYPVVLKLCGHAIAHKTERGLVRLGIADAASAHAAADGLLGAATASDGPVELLVAPIVAHHRELIAGLVRDPQFGPCVMLGVGGILAEGLRTSRSGSSRRATSTPTR